MEFVTYESVGGVGAQIATLCPCVCRSTPGETTPPQHVLKHTIPTGCNTSPIFQKEEERVTNLL